MLKHNKNSSLFKTLKIKTFKIDWKLKIENWKFENDAKRILCWEEGGDDVKSAWPLMPWATHVLQWPVQRVAKSQDGANPLKPVPVRIGVCNSTPWSWNR